ncbi:MAG TPA: site-2 protease family protein [Thermoanaerobaculia bacterium]|nr:site-2 protease family protein [Thermoanaerobaculia bacterium]
MDSNILFIRGVQYLLLLLGISLHEAAHAWTAARRGDVTAALLGRASLNPLRHLDPVGSVLLPFLLLAFGPLFAWPVFGWPVFGWGRPTPVVVKNLKNPWRDDILVTASGAAANLLLACLATVGLSIAVHVLGPQARQAAYLTLLQQLGPASRLAGFPVVFTLVQAAYVNAFLALFHLLPFPPLDGGQIALSLLPTDWAERYSRLRPYGFSLGIFLGVCGILSVLLLPFAIVLNLVAQL